MKPLRLFGIRLPGVHSIHWKVFIILMAVLILPMGYVAMQVRKSIETSYLHSTEEGMIDTGAVIAELYARLVEEYGLDSSRLTEEFGEVFANLRETYPLKARLFGFTRAEVDTRLLLYDRRGRVVYDTEHRASAGTDFSGWSDVSKALHGGYGARWELDRERQRVYLFSTLPVMLNNRVIGAVSVSKSTNRIRNFISRSLRNLLLPGFLALLLATAMAYALSAYITRILWSLASKAERIAAGESGVRLETWTRSELGVLARAVERMREKLEGKAYVEQTVTHLSHELKTPLAAIRGAAEVLEDGAVEDPQARTKFLRNIQSEVGRLDQIVSRLIQLARIEARPAAEEDPPVDILPLLRSLGENYQARAEGLGIRMETTIPPDGVWNVRIEEAKFRQLMECLLDNALQFTPSGKEIRLGVRPDAGTVLVSDEGAGIEPDLLPKVFDRFFTTENPRTGNRGTGLGLAIARSIAETVGGSISVESKSGSGAVFSVRLPTVS